MKITILRVVIVVFFLTSSQVYADSPKSIKGKGAMGRGADKSASADRIANEAADAVTDALIGKDSQGSSGNIPPGLAKQGKTPPGWDKGKKAY